MRKKKSTVPARIRAGLKARAVFCVFALSAALICILGGCGPEPGRDEDGSVSFAGDHSAAETVVSEAGDASLSERTGADAESAAADGSAGTEEVTTAEGSRDASLSGKTGAGSTAAAKTAGTMTETAAAETVGTMTETAAAKTAGTMTETAAAETAGTMTETAAAETAGTMTETAAAETAGTMTETAAAGTAGTMSGTAATDAEAAAGKDRTAETDGAASVFPLPDKGEVDEETLSRIEACLDRDDCCGFLFSAYEKPEEIDLAGVFAFGAGSAQEKLEKKEKELLQSRLPKGKTGASIVKVTQKQADRLLKQKAGIDSEQSLKPLSKEKGWAHIGRFEAWYAYLPDTPRRHIKCTDAWRQGNDLIVHYRLEPESFVYEARLLLNERERSFLFFSNILWVQKGLIEAQSYEAQLSPVGEVFFAPFYPDKNAGEGADVIFALVQDGGLLQVLEPMEEGNIRTGLVFRGVDAVDFTDYNGDGCTDILSVCSYDRIGSDGKRAGSTREARVYTGRKDGAPSLDEERTREVNRSVETPDITNITAFLTGKNDGKTKKYGSWKEAYASHVQDTDTGEYDGFALIYLNDDRVPELVQVGATSAKGATILVYKNGALQETWLNRRSFEYLENENLLYSASGMENLHYDTIYSIMGGRLSISVQGYYGNRRFARAQIDGQGKETSEYRWDGGVVSENGYRDGLAFVFDRSRAKTCGGKKEELMTAEELLKKLGE